MLQSVFILREIMEAELNNASGLPEKISMYASSLDFPFQFYILTIIFS